LPSLTLVNPRGTTQTVTELGALEHYLRRGYNPQAGTVASARTLFTGQTAAPAPLESGTTYERVGYPRQPGAFTALANALADGQQSMSFAALGDSTVGGYLSPGRFPRLAAAAIGAAFPAYGVQVTGWNDTTQAYDPAYTQIQAPPAGPRYLNFATSTARHPGDGAALVDIDVQVKVSFNTWANGPGTVGVPVSRLGGAGQRGFQCFVNANGTINLSWTSDGTTILYGGAGAGATVPTVTPGVPLWLRYTLDVDNGASGYTGTYYASYNDRATWVQLGTATVAGVTSVFNPPAFDYELGGSNGGTSPFPGRIYEVHVSGTIGSQHSVVPRWVDHWAPQATTVTLGGSPMLTLLQGGIPGAALTYLNDPVRCPKMAPKGWHTLAVLLGCGHNDVNRRGTPYLADWDLWLTRVRANWPYAALAVTTQNPRTAPATYRMEHRVRQDDIRMWAARNNATLIDAYRAFIENPDGWTQLIQADGIHPTVDDGVTDGAALWGQALTSAVVARA
jgi:lysophospholipase L1-like esterase